jgi:hypothetical protein
MGGSRRGILHEGKAIIAANPKIELLTGMDFPWPPDTQVQRFYDKEVVVSRKVRARTSRCDNSATTGCEPA